MFRDQDNRHLLELVSDPARVIELQGELRTVVDGWRGDVAIVIKQPGWDAVPLKSSDHFNVVDEARLLQAIRDLGTERVWTLPIEQLGDSYPAAMRVTATAAGLHAFQRECGHFNVALFGEGPAWVVVCTTHGYFIVAGPPAFVRTAAGGDVSEVFMRFRAYASDPGWRGEIRDRVRNVLLGVLEMLQKD